jgi:hypothetical protein
MMSNLSISIFRRSGQRRAPAGTLPRLSSDGRRSRAESLDIIFRVAATGASECAAWIIPVLERSELNDHSTRETWTC